MLFGHIRFVASAALVLGLLLGQITDATTGQPLSGVHVRAGGKTSTTDRTGRYRLSLPTGAYTLRWQSNDVPAQHAAVTVRTRTVFNIKACSTTLDYSCGGNGPSSSSGA